MRSLARVEQRGSSPLVAGSWIWYAVRLVDIAALMYVSVGFADVLDVMSAASRTAFHLRHSAPRGNTKSLLVRVTLRLSKVSLSGHSWLLAVLGIRSTIAVRNGGGGTGHCGVV